MSNSKKSQFQVRQMTIAQFEKQFVTETDCRDYLQANRWPEGVCCARCGNTDVFAVGIKEHHWQCKACAVDGYRFSVLVGTIFENTNKPLRQWFCVMHMMLTSKRGISALQVHRVMGFGSYETTLNMCNKIRVALSNVEFKQLIGFVELDETFVGGKAKNKHKCHSGRGDNGGTGGHGKAIVVGDVEYKGNVIARVIDNVSGATLTRFAREVLSTEVSLLSADEANGYRNLNPEYPHGFGRHSRDEYVHGARHTNTTEGFWSILQRGVIGTFHKVSAKYLPLCVNEIEFCYNNRMNADIFGVAIRAC